MSRRRPASTPSATQVDPRAPRRAHPIVQQDQRPQRRCENGRAELRRRHREHRDAGHQHHRHRRLRRADHGAAEREHRPERQHDAELRQEIDAGDAGQAVCDLGEPERQRRAEFGAERGIRGRSPAPAGAGRAAPHRTAPAPASTAPPAAPPLSRTACAGACAAARRTRTWIPLRRRPPLRANFIARAISAKTAVVCVEISARRPAIYKQRPLREPVFKESYDFGRLQRQNGIRHGHFDHGLAVECRDRRERAAVMDGGTEPVQCVEVLRHAVAHVALEAVARMREAHPHHQPVAGDLGDDRGRRDRRHQRIAGDHRLAVAAAVDTVAAVDEHELGPDRQRPHRASERPQRCAQDIVAVDPVGRAERHGNLGGGADFRVELLALLVIELLGIIEPARDAVRIEDDGGGHHRARERTAAGLVAARHRPDALRQRAALAAERRAEDFLHQRQTLDVFRRFGGGGPNSCARSCALTPSSQMVRSSTQESTGTKR